MHFEILVEDQSGKKALDVLVPKIIGAAHTFRIHAYKGIGRVPRNLTTRVDANKRILLARLPELLRGYGKTYPCNLQGYSVAIIVVCDLDDKCLSTFRQELLSILDTCNPQPLTRFCIAIEEGEAWFLGDILAIKAAYPQAKDNILNGYQNDSICGTWECLADAVYAGGANTLSALSWQAVGAEKSRWAEQICHHMVPDRNKSPSFQYFRSKLLELIGQY